MLKKEDWKGRERVRNKSRKLDEEVTLKGRAREPEK